MKCSELTLHAMPHVHRDRFCLPPAKTGRSLFLMRGKTQPGFLDWSSPVAGSTAQFNEIAPFALPLHSLDLEGAYAKIILHYAKTNSTGVDVSR